MIEYSGGIQLVLERERHKLDDISAQKTIRTLLDIPVPLHCRLHEAASRQGCSARQLILRSIEQEVKELEPQRLRRRLTLDAPIVAAQGRRLNHTNEQLCDLAEFP